MAALLKNQRLCAGDASAQAGCSSRENHGSTMKYEQWSDDSTESYP